MLLWSLQITILSIILIFLVHHLILFFKSTLTVPKIKDLVNAPAQKYENIYNILRKGQDGIGEKNINDYIPKNIKNEVDTEINSIKDSMKDELKMFLKKQLNNSSNSTTNIDTLDSYTKNNFSNY
jgi:hypothetical protein